ncbi:hypothetical protein CTI14_59400, partial [Methylobacterium radiotolerans]
VNDFKGLQYVIEALDRLQTQVPICLLTLNDKGRIEKFKDRFQVVELGWTNDDSVMQDVYSATDLFLMPSGQRLQGPAVCNRGAGPLADAGAHLPLDAQRQGP